MKYSLQGKVAIITGASSGIGLASALCLSRLGCKVMLAARNKKRLKSITDSCNQIGQASYFVTDVTDPTNCKSLIDFTIEKYNQLDILILNAGLSMRSSIEACAIEVYHKVMQVNFYGAINCVHHALPHLLKNKGIVVAVSSVAGFTPLPFRSGYVASKYAFNGFFDTLRTEYKKSDLHVLTIYPGYTQSSIRVNALDGNGDIIGLSNKNEADLMSAEVVAEKMASAIQSKKEMLILTFSGKFAFWMQRFLPKLTLRLLRKSASSQQGITKINHA